MILVNKKVVITGASSGIGAAVANLLSKQGAEVFLVARNPDKLQQLQERIVKAGGKANYYSADLTHYPEVLTMAQVVAETMGAPDLLINSAGAGEWLSFQETPGETFEQMMASPYLATVYTCKAFYEMMVSVENSQIIVINSAASYFHFPGAAGYIAARWALRGFTESLRHDLRHTGLKVSMIVAGKVDSPYFTNNPVSAERIPGIVDTLIKTLSVDEMAKIILKTIQRRTDTLIVPRMMAVSVWLNRLIPGVFIWLMRKTGYQNTHN
jgi:short-subunit dehydrogenase